MFNKKVVISFVLLSLLLSPWQLAKAQEASQAATPSATQALKERIEKVVEEKKEDVQRKLKEKKQKKQSMVGNVERVSQEAITVRNAEGTIIIPVNDELTLIKEDEPIAVDDITVGDGAILLGFNIDDDFKVFRIIITKDNPLPRTQVVMMGSIQAFDRDSLTILSRANQTELEVKLSKDSKLHDNQGEEIALGDLFEQMQVLVVGVKDEAKDESGATTQALIVRSLAPIEE